MCPIDEFRLMKAPREGLAIMLKPPVITWTSGLYIWTRNLHRYSMRLILEVVNVSWVQSMGSSGRSTLGRTVGGSPEFPNPRLPANRNRRLHSPSPLGAGMSSNSSMIALQCISTAGEFGGFKENSNGISHPLTRQTFLIAAISPGFILWPSRHPIVLSSPFAYTNRSPDPPNTRRIVCKADALTPPKVLPRALQVPLATSSHRTPHSGGVPGCHRSLA